MEVDNSLWVIKMKVSVNGIEGGWGGIREGPTSPRAVCGTKIIPMNLIKYEEIKL
jgi:hypothetical protein